MPTRKMLKLRHSKKSEKKFNARERAKRKDFVAKNGPEAANISGDKWLSPDVRRGLLAALGFDEKCTPTPVASMKLDRKLN
jgi:hypothetical protein